LLYEGFQNLFGFALMTKLNPFLKFELKAGLVLVF
jgi:hypothetical protein